MRKTTVAVFSAWALLVFVNAPSASAQSVDLLSINSSTSVTNVSEQKPEKLQVVPYRVTIVPKIDSEKLPAVAEIPPEPEPVVPVIHEVTAGQSLSSIADQYKITWVRLFNKNDIVTNPDVISAGQKLVVPLPDEKLVDRPLPEPPVDVAPVVQASPKAAPPKAAPKANNATITRKAPASSPVVASRGSSAGNTYYAGYCTWYAKSMRPDLPNSLGNAGTWVARAAAQGIATGSTPRVGAIGQQAGHVVYVQRVNGDGTIFVSEMNYNGAFNRVTTRTASASSFQYIY